MMMRLQIERARPDDAADVMQLLESHHLPVDGLVEHFGNTIVARQDGAIVGSAALEVYGDGALLRSVAVSEALRGSGLGRELTNAALDLARDIRVPAVYLLTTTAEAYFPRFGFERITRDEVPAGVRTSVEFTSACPSSATVMRACL